MRTILLSVIALAAAAPAARPAAASSPAPVCTAMAAPPPDMAGWTRPAALKAGTDAASAPPLTPGIAADVAVAQVGRLRFVVPVGRMSAPADKGGLLTFTAPGAGTYRIALGSGGWIDVVRGGMSVPSTAHGHGADCTGIRKMVDFALQPGAYTVQISGAAMDVVRVLIVRLP